MKDLPVVSIVTPSYNQAQFLEEAIRSVLEQDYPHIEYIIYDGGSTDGSVEIIKNYERHLAYWVSEKDKGQSAAINKGWKRAAGQIYTWLNSDDKLEPGAVRTVVKAFQDNPHAGVVHGDLCFLDREGHELGLAHGALSDFDRLLRDGQDHVFQPGSFFRAVLVNQVGLLDETLHMSMDYDLLLRLAQVSEMVYVPRVLACYRIHAATKSSLLTEHHQQETSLVRARYGGRYLLKPRLRYLAYRCFHITPKFVKTWFRRWRNSPTDRVYLQSEKNTTNKERS